jgi:predicted enzyme related to lactoylglutathione lyase
MDAQGAPSRWLIYFVAENLDETVTSIGELGGTIMVPPMSVPPEGHILVARDPQGAVFALFQGETDETEGPTETQAKRLTRFPLGELS